MLNDFPKVIEKFHTCSSKLHCFKNKMNEEINLTLKWKDVDILKTPSSFAFLLKHHGILMTT